MSLSRIHIDDPAIYKDFPVEFLGVTYYPVDGYNLFGSCCRQALPAAFADDPSACEMILDYCVRADAVPDDDGYVSVVSDLHMWGDTDVSNPTSVELLTWPHPFDQFPPDPDRYVTATVNGRTYCFCVYDPTSRECETYYDSASGQLITCGQAICLDDAVNARGERPVYELTWSGPLVAPHEHA